MRIGIRLIAIMMALVSCSTRDDRFADAIAHAREACAKGPLSILDNDRWEAYQKSLADLGTEPAKQVRAGLGIDIIQVERTQRTGNLSAFDDPSWQLIQHGQPIAALFFMRFAIEIMGKFMMDRIQFCLPALMKRSRNIFSF